MLAWQADAVLNRAVGEGSTGKVGLRRWEGGIEKVAFKQKLKRVKELVMRLEEENSREGFHK